MAGMSAEQWVNSLVQRGISDAKLSNVLFHLQRGTQSAPESVRSRLEEKQMALRKHLERSKTTITVEHDLLPYGTELPMSD